MTAALQIANCASVLCSIHILGASSVLERKKLCKFTGVCTKVFYSRTPPGFIDEMSSSHFSKSHATLQV